MSMVHLSLGMKEPRLAAAALGAGDHRGHGDGEPAGVEDAVAGLRRRLRPHPRHDGAGARGLRRLQRAVREPHGFRIPQPAREREFRTPSGRAEFSHAPLPDVVPPEGG